MRVLWITGNYQPEIGGIQVYTDRVTNALSEDCQVGLITGAQHTCPDNPAIAHFPIAHLTAPRDHQQWRQAQADVASVLAEFAPDIVHLANANVAVYRPAIGRSVPVIASIHGNDLTAPWQHIPGRQTTRCIFEGLNQCDRIIAVSHHTAGLARAAGVTPPLTVLRSGCDLDFFSPGSWGRDATRARYGVPPDVPVVLTVARLVPRKGHLVTGEALRMLPFPVYWLVVGDGRVREPLLAAISESGMSDRVCLTGEVSNEELRFLYQACDVFVLAPEEQRSGRQLDSEGFGLVFLEAGACGKPVIASDVSGCREAVTHGCTGLLVPPGDSASLASAIECVVSNRDYASALGFGGLASVRSSGGWLRLARQLEEIYSDLVADSRSEQDLIRFYRV